MAFTRAAIAAVTGAVFLPSEKISGGLKRECLLLPPEENFGTTFAMREA